MFELFLILLVVIWLAFGAAALLRLNGHMHVLRSVDIAVLTLGPMGLMLALVARPRFQ
ncbi:MAG: hypothetical protein OXH19_05325 [Chloroflexi bacterium]|nr:hypothetical protein [Chloroflexota bacterium]MCY3588351.1 hypothetical protein [Chloroflexota bacterium]MCY3684830.1 hypothetical protein [Chloroflexota bacterium]MDE2708660.1 hypothetical protein [Chloroflexota bacterium]